MQMILLQFLTSHDGIRISRYNNHPDGAGSTDEDGMILTAFGLVDENGMPLNLSSNGLNDNIFNLCDEDNDEDLRLPNYRLYS